MKFAGKHVLITGASEGIGFAFAVEVAKENAKVTLVSRNVNKLEEAKRKLLEQTGISSDTIFVSPADVTDMDKVLEAFAAAEAALGPIDILVCNAGIAVPGYFHEQDVSVFQQHMNLNYFGVVHSVKAVYEKMLRRNSGHICLVSSGLGVFGIVGYTAYCASKHAVKGLADSLRNELQGTGVTMSVAMPPDTETPGFEEENLHKPVETKEISKNSDTFTATQVAEAMLKGMKRDLYILPCPDFGLDLHYRLTKGFVPRRFPGVLLDMFWGCLGPIIHHFFGGEFDKVARKHAGTRFARFQ